MKFWDYITGKTIINRAPQPMMIGNPVSWYNKDGVSFLKNGFGDNDIIYSAVNMVMDKARSTPWNVYKIEDESSLKSYKSLMNKKEISADEWRKAINLRTKALVPIEKGKSKSSKLEKLIQLLEWPNENETFGDLVAGSIGYEMILGNSFWDGHILDEGADEGLPWEINNLAPQYTTIIATRGYPSRVVGYLFNIDGGIEMKKERVLHVKSWNPEYDINGSHLLGMSPLSPGSKTIKRNNSAKHAGVMGFENGGAIGVLYIDDPLVKGDDARAQIEATKKKWAGEYTGADAFLKVAHSGYKTGFTKITDTLVDLNLVAIEDLDLRRILNLWGLPSQLFNDPANKSYNNQKEAEKALTGRCVVPRLCVRRDNLNRKLKTHWGFKNENVFVDFDISVFPELQEDSAKKWEYVKQLPISSRSKLEMMGLDVDDNPALDEVLIPTGFQKLSDIAANLDNEIDQIDELEKNRKKDPDELDDEDK